MYSRIFQMWYYTVSHGQMLLRSVGSEKQYNIDIYFGDVSYIEMPTSINKIEILETTQEDIDYIRQKIGGIDDIITVLLSDSHKYYIVSSIMKIFKNDLEMFELPFDILNYTSKNCR